ncbi:VCBS repeat-containing protein [Flavihumibacter solisilvae]|uniref:VCBS repeat-containing protein n=1 Tax=Flavihumibacter solisilvae TaxID=1349421 RepID=UPI00068D20C0|nr:FG-GAP-like repeat-containing protein [Flavihumibacter solisilvae]
MIANKKNFFIAVVTACACISSTIAQQASPLFTLLSEKQTGIQFLNQVNEDDSLNVLRYEYLYNGAGVGIGDFNKDGLDDIYFSGNSTPGKLFINKGGFRFEDVTRSSGTAGNGTWATGVAVADVNGDGWPDIYVCHSGKYSDPAKLKNELFINQGVVNGQVKFTEQAAAFGLDAPGTQSTQAAFLDYDRDGDLDMFLVNHSNHTYNPFLNTRKVRSTPNMQFGNRLFRNNGISNGAAVFEDVTLQSGIVNHALNFGLSVTVSDFNGDGWPDMYTTSDYSEKDCLYINMGNGTFTEQLERSFAHISKYSMGADVADYNNDGLPDLFTLDMLPENNYRQKLLRGPDEYDQYHLLWDSGYYKQQMRNMLQLNRGQDEKGNLRFSEIGQFAGVSNTDWSWAGLFADFDNDGWKDLLVTNGYLRDFTNMDFLKYTVADAKIKAAQQGHQNFQTQALVKEMPANKVSNYIFRNNHDLSFSDKTREWGLMKPAVSNAAAYADFDNDGDLDLVICNNNEPAMLYRNNREQAGSNNFIRITCKGPAGNTMALGAKVKVITSGGLTQMQEINPVRGYQSTVSNQLNFGIPGTAQVQRVTVTWPDGTVSERGEAAAGQQLVFEHGKDVAAKGESTKPAAKIFTDVTRTSGIDFVHRENDFVDFKDEVLLPYMLSRKGPALAVADVNGDKLDDVFLGGAIGQAGVLYIQTAGSTFQRCTSQPWIADSSSEDVNAIFFDADNDGDPDLYVVSGGNEYGDQSPEYADRLYLNDGKGNFEKSTSAVPQMLSPKQAVAAGDYDHDGDLDLFVGGMSVPGFFPQAARSYLLRNDSKNGRVLFTEIMADAAPALQSPGMINDALWADTDGDNFPELFLAGDWMPLQCWKNENGTFRKQLISKNDTLSGLWSAIRAADLDDDGDLDFLLGNAGRNNQFKASASQPMTIVAGDFDNNGSTDPIFSYYIQGKSYPSPSRDELLDQIVPLRKKFIHYSDYANASINDIVPAAAFAKAQQVTCNQLSSGVLWNEGKSGFRFESLPSEAQLSCVNGFVVNDFDNDHKNEVFLAGNFEAYRVQLGQSDAGLGLLVKIDENKGFLPLTPMQAGNYAGGDIRRIAMVRSKDSNMVILAGNNQQPQILKINPR